MNWNPLVRLYRWFHHRQVLTTIRLGNELPAEDQMQLVTSESEDLLLKYISNQPLCPKAQIAMMNHPDMAHLLPFYIDRYSLAPVAQRELFALPDVAVAIYTEQHPLCQEVEALVFKMEDPEERVMQYIGLHPFESAAAELKMFELANAPKLVEKYVGKYHLQPKAQVKLFTLPNKKKVLETYAGKYPFCTEVQQRLVACAN